MITFSILLDILAAHVVATANQFTQVQVRLCCRCAIIAGAFRLARFCWLSVFKLQQLAFIAYQYCPNQPVLMNDAFFIIALGFINKHHFFIIATVRAFGQAYTAQVKTM
jgi:hypothetical protein